MAWQANTGVHALRRATEDFFLDLLPDVLSRTAEVDGVFYEARKGQKPPEHGNRARVLTNLRKGDCDAEVALFLPRGDEFIEILMRIEINVHRVNLNLCFDRTTFTKLCPAYSMHEHQPEFSGDSRKASAMWLHEALAHSLGGALHPGVDPDQPQQAQHGHNPDAHRTERLEYEFNDLTIDRIVCGRSVICLVAAISLPKDFLWDASERLYFAQDLMILLRACTLERPDLFRGFKPECMKKEIARLQSAKPGEHTV